ncbi:1-deoxy-D-xylulose-5-phosphate synthase [Pyrococcus sp. NA2]|uniref:hypothetical protein n=1 Tax=Pyrococcus sp. (strain NA2) TaxID=342949 RepID=UPI000209AAEE|nr:hypothetical protein [Pyrococcus sp. NA2]AEC52016.1 1-deoxy-D-xylulose-5-phosphate synthase [Pyrococcus sp. NA2]
MRKPLIVLIVVLLISISLTYAYSKYRELKEREEMELDLNASIKMLKNHLQRYAISYNSTYYQYLNQKVTKNESEIAINRVLLLRNRLMQLNATKNEVRNIDECLNETYTFQKEGTFYDAMTQARVCAILASDYIGSHLIIKNREEFLENAFRELQNMTKLQLELEREWKARTRESMNFTDYMVIGFRIEHNLIEARIYLNETKIILEKLNSVEDIENLTLLGSRIMSNLEYARSFLKDASVLMKHVSDGNFLPSELKDYVEILKRNLSVVDRPCNLTIMPVKVACDWKDYHKVRGTIALQEGYYSAASYHLLQALAIAENLDEFKVLILKFNGSKRLTDKTKLILKLREETIESIKRCPSDPLTSLYLKDATEWYFKRAELILRDIMNPNVYYSLYKIHEYPSILVYDYEMTKILTQKSCSYLSMIMKRFG